MHRCSPPALWRHGQAKASRRPTARPCQGRINGGMRLPDVKGQVQGSRRALHACQVRLDLAGSMIHQRNGLKEAVCPNQTSEKTRLDAALLPLGCGTRVDGDACPHPHSKPTLLQAHRPNGHAPGKVAHPVGGPARGRGSGRVYPPHAAAINPSGLGLKALDPLHGLSLGRAGHRSAWKGRPKDVFQAGLGPQP